MSALTKANKSIGCQQQSSIRLHSGLSFLPLSSIPPSDSALGCPFCLCPALLHQTPLWAVLSASVQHSSIRLRSGLSFLPLSSTRPSDSALGCPFCLCPGDSLYRQHCFSLASSCCWVVPSSFPPLGARLFPSG